MRALMALAISRPSEASPESARSEEPVHRTQRVGRLLGKSHESIQQITHIGPQRRGFQVDMSDGSETVGLQLLGGLFQVVTGDKVGVGVVSGP